MSCPNPVPFWAEQGGSVVVAFHPAPGFTAQVTAQVTDDLIGLSPPYQTPQSRDELMQQLELGHREHFRRAYLLAGQGATCNCHLTIHKN